MGEWTSKEHVWGEDDLGRRTLRYAPGDPIPEEEARRQGLVEGKHQAGPPATKHVEAPQATKSPQGPPQPAKRAGTPRRGS